MWCKVSRPWLPSVLEGCHLSSLEEYIHCLRVTLDSSDPSDIDQGVGRRIIVEVVRGCINCLFDASLLFRELELD